MIQFEMIIKITTNYYIVQFITTNYRSILLQKYFRILVITSKHSCLKPISKPISLSQLVTRYARYGRFIRRHLFGLGPITHCQLVLGSADREARPAEGHTSPPGSHAIAGPNEDDAGGNAGRVPPRLPC